MSKLISSKLWDIINNPLAKELDPDFWKTPIPEGIKEYFKPNETKVFFIKTSLESCEKILKEIAVFETRELIDFYPFKKFVIEIQFEDRTNIIYRDFCEENPDLERAILLSQTKGANGVSILNLNDEHEFKYYIYCLACFRYYLQNKSYYEKSETIEFSEKINSTLQKKSVISHVVYIGNKDVPRSESYYGIKRSEFSHRFDRRGTWRKIRGIGKDVNGNYNQIGRTWVVESVVGPEDKPYISKVRYAEAP